MTRDDLKQQLKGLETEGRPRHDARGHCGRGADLRRGSGLDSIDAPELAVLVEENFRVSIPTKRASRPCLIDALADFILAN